MGNAEKLLFFVSGRAISEQYRGAMKNGVGKNEKQIFCHRKRLSYFILQNFLHGSCIYLFSYLLSLRSNPIINNNAMTIFPFGFDLTFHVFGCTELFLCQYFFPPVFASLFCTTDHCPARQFFAAYMAFHYYFYVDS